MKIVHLKIHEDQKVFGREGKKLVLKRRNQRIPLNLARKGKEVKRKKDKIRYYLSKN